MLTRNSVLYAKVESTYGTDAVPTPSDAVLVESLAWSNAGLGMIERPGVHGSLGTVQHVFAGRLLQVTFDAEIKGSGTIDAPPEIGALLQACGLAETITATTSVSYDPVSTGIESATIYIYEDGKRIKVLGVRGNVSFALTAGGIMKASFTMTGHVEAQTDTALPVPTLDATVPPPFIGASFTVDSFAGVIEALNFDMGNAVALPKSANGPDGYGEVTITGRDVNGSVNPQDELVATEDWVGNFTSGSSMALTTGTVGSAVGNRVAMSMPGVYYRDLAPADRDGIRAFDLTFGAAETAALNDEVAIIFT